MKELTVGELRKALEDVNDNLIVRISSDTGVDQRDGFECIVENAYEVNYEHKDDKNNSTHIQYFTIYANYCDEDLDDEE